MYERVVLASFGLVLLFTISAALLDTLDEGANCITPNGEGAQCVPLTSCAVLLTSLQMKNENAINFVREAHCGFRAKTPLVCCGTMTFGETDPLDEILDDYFKNANKSGSTSDQTQEKVEQEEDKVDDIVLHNFKTDKLPDKSVCGVEVHESWQGGEQTDLHEFPWLAALEYKDISSGQNVGIKCVGVIINKRYVLTTAQCIADRVYVLNNVRLGEWDVDSDPDCISLSGYGICSEPVVKINILEVLTHPFYNKKLGSNNIGLIKLEKDVTYDEFVRPICLPPQDYAAPERDTPLSVTGWGKVENELTSNMKLKDVVTFLPFEECQQDLEKNKTNKMKVEVLRACGKKSDKDACRESLGGPVMRRYLLPNKKRSQWYLEGLVISECNLGEDSVIYIRVSRYIEWILETILDNKIL